MQLPGKQRLVVLGRPEAEHVRIEQKPPATAPGPQGVSVVSENPGDRSAVGIEGRRAVVRLDLPDEDTVLVDPHHARVVIEDLQEPVLSPRA